jgi:sigma-B regulation protein RsbU (phosphoserine phosphatase)
METKYGQYSTDIINGMIDWVRVIDARHRIVFMNNAMKDQTGDFIGKKCYQGLGLDSPCPNCITDETLKTGRIHLKEETVGGRTFSVASSPIRDETGRVCSAVEVFRDITKEKTLEISIKEQNKKFNANLCFAKMLQQKMLPEKGIVNGYLSIDYSYIPCEMLGGDLFDVFPADDRSTAIYIFDIAGHGIMSSMITMFVRQTVRALAEGGCSPSSVLRGLSQKFNQLGLESDSFITILYGIYHRENSTFTYANGGHNPPLLLRKGSARFVEGTGIPICSLSECCEYQQYKLELERDDFLYLYTDGITEARNTAGEFFGLEGLARAAEQSVSINGIIKSVESFSQGKLTDDIAILSAEIL